MGAPTLYDLGIIGLDPSCGLAQFNMGPMEVIGDGYIHVFFRT